MPPQWEQGGSGDIQEGVRNCEAACADFVRMMQTNSDLFNDTDLNDTDLAAVHGGQMPARVIDPTPILDEPTLQELLERLRRRGLRGA